MSTWWVPPVNPNFLTIFPYKTIKKTEKQYLPQIRQNVTILSSSQKQKCEKFLGDYYGRTISDLIGYIEIELNLSLRSEATLLNAALPARNVVEGAIILLSILGSQQICEKWLSLRISDTKEFMTELGKFYPLESERLEHEKKMNLYYRDLDSQARKMFPGFTPNWDQSPLKIGPLATRLGPHWRAQFDAFYKLASKFVHPSPLGVHTMNQYNTPEDPLYSILLGAAIHSFAVMNFQLGVAHPDVAVDNVFITK